MICDIIKRELRGGDAIDRLDSTLYGKSNIG